MRPWRDADGNPAAYQDGQPVVLDERAVNRTVVVADPDGVAPGSVRFSHQTGRYTLDALGPAGVTGLTTLTVDGDGELEVRNANGYAGTTDLRRGLLSLGDDAALGHSTLLVGAARGSATGGGPVTVQAAAVLGGAGTLTGPVTVERGGTVAPGHAPGDGATLAATGGLALRRGAVLDVDVAPEDGGIDVAPEGTRGPGPRPAEREADRLRVAGGVLLDQAELRVTLAPGTPPGGAPLTIVDNTGDGQVAGTFRGLPEGATVTGRTADGRAARFRIDDRGGDGNDVVLEPLRAPDPAPRPVTLAAVADQAVDEGEQLALRLHADPGATARALASTRWWCGALRRHPRLADTRTVTITVTRPPPAIAAYLACTWPNAIMN